MGKMPRIFISEWYYSLDVCMLMKTDLAVKIKEWVHRIFLAKWLKSSLNLLTTQLPQLFNTESYSPVTFWYPPSKQPVKTSNIMEE